MYGGFSGSIRTGHIDAWAEGKGASYTKRIGSNMRLSTDGRTIFSYDEPIGVRFENEAGEPWFLLNGDTFSQTTTQHQSKVRWAVDRVTKKRYIVPFSAVYAAGLKINDLEFVDAEGDVYTQKSYERKVEYAYQLPDGTMSDNWAPEAVSVKLETPHTETVTYESHRLGATLFKGTRTWSEWVPDEAGDETMYSYVRDEETGNYRDVAQHGRHESRTETAYYLSGVDSTAARNRVGYFLTKLAPDCAPSTVAEAYECLVPHEVKWARINNLDVKRQGDIFFIPVSNTESIRTLERSVKAVKAANRHYTGVNIPTRTNDSTRHIASTGLTDEQLIPGGVLDRKCYVKGRILHSGGDHKPLFLGQHWHIAVQNVQAGSWAATGRVD
jgi:hypothetical protein